MLDLLGTAHFYLTPDLTKILTEPLDANVF